MLKVLIDKDNNFFEWRKKADIFPDESFLIEDISENLLSKLAKENSLFGGSLSYHCFIEEASFLSLFDQDLPLNHLKESVNSFILIVNGSSVKTKKFLEKNKIEYIEILANNSQKITPPNVFYLTDCLLSRDKKKFWLVLNNFKEKGVAMESIMPILWWQIKIMKSVVLSGEKAGHKSFVFSKTKSALKNFTKAEVLEMAREFLIIFNEKRFSSSVDNFFLLERFIFKYV